MAKLKLIQSVQCVFLTAFISVETIWLLTFVPSVWFPSIFTPDTFVHNIIQRRSGFPKISIPDGSMVIKNRLYTLKLNNQITSTRKLHC